MKIGILTFHWAQNYGAVLQAYALQSYLRSCGHDAFLIGYKPYGRDFSLVNFILNRKFFHIGEYLRDARKDRQFKKFRDSFIISTRRYGSLEELRQSPPECDIYISGSDQVLHPRTLMKGERHPSAAYMLDFGPEHVCRAGYAVSFGCIEYPPQARQYARNYITNFDLLSVRETSGVAVARSLGYVGDISIVPDPVVLAGRGCFERFVRPYTGEEYTCAYILHGRDNVFAKIRKDFPQVRDAFCVPVEEWVSLIANSHRVITNSFHGTVFALMFHIPFVALLEQGEKAGMNDRFTTLLQRCGLASRALPGYDTSDVKALFAQEIDWQKTDAALKQYAITGKSYLDEVIKSSRKVSV